MAKVCIACGMVPPKPMPKDEKDCPGCGGKGTMKDETKEKKEPKKK